jgi:hypothetical protein
MLTTAQITAGASRLTAGKLKGVDVDQTTSILEMWFTKDLIEKYGYDFRTKLAAFDDTGNDNQVCAQIGACLDKLEDLGFGVSSLQGGRDALNYKEKDEYWQYVQIIFLKMYLLPEEFGVYDIKRRRRVIQSSTIHTRRDEAHCVTNNATERSQRRRWWGYRD